MKKFDKAWLVHQVTGVVSPLPGKAIFRRWAERDGASGEA
jgi:hypothetical protein